MATLLETINQYRSGMAEFNKNSFETNEECDAYADLTYAPPMAQLIEWQEPAASLEEALEPLAIVKEEVHDFRGSLHQYDRTLSLLWSLVGGMPNRERAGK